VSALSIENVGCGLAFLEESLRNQSKRPVAGRAANLGGLRHRIDRGNGAFGLCSPQ
jgi:hypothetical protein